MSLRFSSFLAAISLLALSACAASPAQPSSSSGPSEEPVSAAAAERSAMDPKAIVYSMRGSEESFRKCFMQSIGSRGVVATRFLVAETGHVEEVEVLHSSIGQAGVVACVQRALLEHRFGQLSQAAEGRWTFVFRLTDPIADKDRKGRLSEARRDTRPAMYLTPASRGRLELDKFDEHVQVRYPLFAHCYRDSIRRAGQAGGVLRILISVDGSGSVTQVQDDGSVLPDPFAVDCIAEAFYAMRFQAPVGGPVVVSYRIDLE